MSKQKYIPIMMLVAICANTFSVSAFSSASSLSAEMLRQAGVNQESHQLRIRTEADARFEAMQAANRARMAALAEKTLPSDDVMYSAPELSVLNESERQAALSRTVTRTPLVSSSIAPVTRTSFSSHSSRSSIGNIDIARVEAAWLGWVNSIRIEQGLTPYVSNSLLGATAQEWSEFSRDRGYTTHGRPGDGCVGEKNYACYNFAAIDKWFMDRGVNATVINRSKHTENVGFGSITCSSSDCTDAAIRAIRKTFDYFYSEKSYNGPHYRSMVNPYFTDMGLGLSIKNGTYYLTTHHSTPLR